MRIAFVTGLALLAAGCATPKHYMGIDTRTPLSAEEEVRMAAALSQAPAGQQGCPWREAGGTFTTVACDALPLSRLAGFAAMDSKPALLELGIRFEEGRGIEQDWKKAELAYRLAAWTNTIQTGTQVAGVAGAHGGMEPIIVQGTPGLNQAELRLAKLRARKKAQ